MAIVGMPLEQSRLSSVTHESKFAGRKNRYICSNRMQLSRLEGEIDFLFAIDSWYLVFSVGSSCLNWNN